MRKRKQVSGHWIRELGDNVIEVRFSDAAPSEASLAPPVPASPQLDHTKIARHIGDLLRDPDPGWPKQDFDGRRQQEANLIRLLDAAGFITRLNQAEGPEWRWLGPVFLEELGKRLQRGEL